MCWKYFHVLIPLQTSKYVGLFNPGKPKEPKFDFQMTICFCWRLKNDIFSSNIFLVGREDSPYYNTHKKGLVGVSKD